MRPLMVLGCTSSAGKSLLVTGLVRWFARQGVDVAPFKGQNMSNNARVVAGGEIGVAQWLQARAARLEPTVDMNPVLVKPEGDTRSQVVVGGLVDRRISDLAWTDRGPDLWDAMSCAYCRLADQHELVVMEGAGSPAEINLDDQVNNRLLAHVDAAAVLVSDIDRGGSFAHLYGTWSLVPPPTQERLVGFVLNRFRGDPGLLEPGPSVLTERTGMRNVGVLPELDHDLPDEEGATLRAARSPDTITVAVVRYPLASNLDELHLLPHAARVRWATTPADLIGADLVVLPGSKHVAADANWLRKHELDQAIVAFAQRGGRVLGICGGAMLLGGTVSDPHHVEGEAMGIGLLPLTTTLLPDKVVERVTLDLTDLPEPWSMLDGVRTSGYEIRNGRVQGEGTGASPRFFAEGSVLATTVHGLLEDPAVLERLTGIAPPDVIDTTIDLIADAVDEHLDTGLLLDLCRAR